MIKVARDHGPKEGNKRMMWVKSGKKKFEKLWWDGVIWWRRSKLVVKVRSSCLISFFTSSKLFFFSLHSPFLSPFTSSSSFDSFLHLNISFFLPLYLSLSCRLLLLIIISPPSLVIMTRFLYSVSLPPASFSCNNARREQWTSLLFISSFHFIVKER